MPQQKTTQCSCKLAGMFCAVCPKNKQKNKSSSPTAIWRKNKKISFHIMSPFSWNPTWEILVRGVSSEQVPLFWCASFHIFSLFTLRAVSFHSQCRDLWKCQGSLSMPSWIRDRKHGQCRWSWRKMSPFTKNQSAGMTAKSQYVSHCSFVLKKEEKTLLFFSRRWNFIPLLSSALRLKERSVASLRS